MQLNAEFRLRCCNAGVSGITVFVFNDHSFDFVIAYIGMQWCFRGDAPYLVSFIMTTYAKTRTARRYGQEEER
jgi:hypothetical protein